MLELKLEVVTWGSLGSDDLFYLPLSFLSSASALEEVVDGGRGAAEIIGPGLVQP